MAAILQRWQLQIPSSGRTRGKLGHLTASEENFALRQFYIL